MKKNNLWTGILRSVAAVIFAGMSWFLIFSDSAEALIASPARIEIEADSGERVVSKLNLINNEETSKTYYFSAENFEAQEETGNPKFVSSDEDLSSWIEAPSQITLEPKEKKEIPFNINIPSDAGVGGHFAAIFWGTNPPQTEEGGKVSIGAKVGVLVFLKVRGDIIEKGEIIEFGNLAKSRMQSSIPVDFYYRFENSGNDRSKPAGKLVIKNMFGRETKSIDVNEKQGSVLPESVRKFYVSWGREGSVDVAGLLEKGELYPKKSFFESVKSQLSPFAMGRYTAEINLQYGLKNKEARSSFAFYVIPWQLLFVVFVTLGIVIFGGRFFLHRYNKRIIEKARKSQEDQVK